MNLSRVLISNEHYTHVRLRYEHDTVEFRLKTLSLPTKAQIITASKLEGERLENFQNDLMFMKFSNNNTAKEFMDKGFSFFSKALTADFPSYLMIFTIPQT